MPTMTEIGNKAGKMRDAMQQEASRLRNGGADDRRTADKLVNLSHQASATTLARLFDLIVTHPDKRSALASLGEADYAGEHGQNRG